MKLYIKQKVFSLADKFTVKDEAGNDRWLVQGEFFSLGKRLHVYDTEGRERAMLKQKVFSFLQTYDIFRDGVQEARLCREFSLMRQSYRVEGLPWRLQGDFLSHSYTLYDGEETLMTLSKEWFTWGDSYVLDITGNADELLCLCIMLGVDCANAGNGAVNVTVGN